MSFKKLATQDKQYIGNTYTRLPLEIKKAKGSYLYDEKNKKYLDFLTGIAVLPLGHLHMNVKKAITSKLNSYIHLSNYFADQSQLDLAKILIDKTFADKVFYVNSGAEATDLSIKLARKWAVANKGPKANEIICMRNSFHGRTMGAISLTAQPKFHNDIGPLIGGVKVVDYNDIGAVKRAIGKKTAAVIAEPIQCEGGINIPKIDYFTRLKNLCHKHNVLLIADEIQTGLGRTGKFLACEHSLMTPDIVLLGKSLGGGLPLSAVITTDKIAEAITYGDHGTTMGGNPIACAAGEATLKEIISSKMIPKVEKLGIKFRKELLSLETKYETMSNVRNMGLIIGFDVPFATEFVTECLKSGLLVNKVRDHTIRFLPPFNLKDTEFKAAFKILETVLKKLDKRHLEY